MTTVRPDGQGEGAGQAAVGVERARAVAAAVQVEDDLPVRRAGGGQALGGPVGQLEHLDRHAVGCGRRSGQRREVGPALQERGARVAASRRGAGG